jgi:hypothetical protein
MNPIASVRTTGIEEGLYGTIIYLYGLRALQTALYVAILARGCSDKANRLSVEDTWF